MRIDAIGFMPSFAKPLTANHLPSNISTPSTNDSKTGKQTGGSASKTCRIFQVAFTWALSNFDGPAGNALLGGLAGFGAALTDRVGRPADSLEICQRMSHLCENRNDRINLHVWIGNQALVLQEWGRLDEALALHKKKEDICLALSDQDGLQISYGNQAIILQIRGQIEEAFALLKREEEICLALGNQDGLQISYGNQGLILQAWGRLEEALALHKREEEICLALGYKRGLGFCYYNWGPVERALNHPQAEREKLTAAFGIFEDLKMPRERDAVKAELDRTTTGGSPQS